MEDGPFYLTWHSGAHTSIQSDPSFHFHFHWYHLAKMHPVVIVISLQLLGSSHRQTHPNSEEEAQKPVRSSGAAVLEKGWHHELSIKYGEFYSSSNYFNSIPDPYINIDESVNSSCTIFLFFIVIWPESMPRMPRSKRIDSN